MNNRQPVPEIPRDGSAPNRIQKPHAKIRKTQSGVRSALKTLGAWGIIAGSSIVGGKEVGDMAAKAAHHKVRPVINNINEAVTPRVCRDDYEGFKGIILGEMDGKLGKMINGVLDSVDMKRKIQKWLDAITAKMNIFREDLCGGLKKVPELTDEIDQGIQSFTRFMVRWMTTSMLLLALSMLYRGHKSRSLKKIADREFDELERELARERISREELIEGHNRVEQRVRMLEDLLRKNGIMPAVPEVEYEDEDM